MMMIDATDKASWGPGPWQNEPDRIEWRGEDGHACLMRRAKITGAWCGYVGVDPGHPWYGKQWRDIPGVDDADVHGGVTWGGRLPDESPDVWWIGFDCGHYGDAMPGLCHILGADPGAIYRDVDYVRFDVASLASAAKMAGKR